MKVNIFGGQERVDSTESSLCTSVLFVTPEGEFSEAMLGLWGRLYPGSMDDHAGLSGGQAATIVSTVVPL